MPNKSINLTGWVFTSGRVCVRPGYFQISQNMRKKMKITMRILLGVIVLFVILMYVFIGSMPQLPSTGTTAPPSIDTQAPQELEQRPEVNPLQVIDRILEKMALGSIAFNVPKIMNLHKPVLIHLMLGVEKEIEDIKRMIEEEGEKVGANVRVSNRMEARLLGQNFEITTITPEVQAIARKEVTEWKWEIKPRVEGKQNLHLTLSALLSIEGESTPRVIRTFDRIINVEVTMSQKAKVFIHNNWQWLGAVIFAPLVAWAWKKRDIS